MAEANSKARARSATVNNFIKFMIAQNDKYDLRWMEQVVTRLGQLNHTELEKTLKARVKQFSLGLFCEYTKVMLKEPVRLTSCHHAYCLEREVLTELGECSCGQTLKDSSIVTAAEVREILDYLAHYELNCREVMVVLDFKCFFPLAKQRIVYKPSKLLHEVLKASCEFRDGKYVWRCEHKPFQLVDSSSVAQLLDSLECGCGLNGFATLKPARIKVRID